MNVSISITAQYLSIVCALLFSIWPCDRLCEWIWGFAWLEFLANSMGEDGTFG